jgi:agmatinase
MSLYYAQSSLAEAHTVVLGIPYDRTSSFIPGSRFGPAHVRLATDNVESYSPWQQRDLSALKVHDAGDLRLEDMTWPGVTRQIRGRVKALLKASKLIVSLGGEHSITGPLVAAVQESHPELVVVQFDAHADLRPEFLHEPHSHAAAMYAAAQSVGRERVYQFGIRSGTEDEFHSARHLYPFTVLEPLRQCLPDLRRHPIYLTIDLDVLDPGVMPAVATPEPGGIDYRELIAALLLLRDCRLVGIDVVEYNPLASRDLASASLVAGLLRELILLGNPAPQDQPQEHEGNRG